MKGGSLRFMIRRGAERMRQKEDYPSGGAEWRRLDGGRLNGGRLIGGRWKGGRRKGGRLFGGRQKEDYLMTGG
jgi:hypothetical protein